MNLLLDTHTFLWLVEGSHKLSARARDVLVDSRNQVYLSVASIWELAIKTSSSKLTLSSPLDIFVTKWIGTYLIETLPIERSHVLAIVGLGDYHRDPFDRILIAQAIIEGMTLVSGDSKFHPYKVPTIW